jgi:hypothetical protein
MNPAVPDRQPRKTPVAKRASIASERTESATSQATGVVPRWLSGWRGELVLLALVLVGIAIFFVGYGVGVRDDTFRTDWYSPLRGTSAAPLAVASVQGGAIDRSGNTRLLVTVRGLRILPAGATYVLSVIRNGASPEHCGYFGVGKGTTQIHLSCPNLPAAPNDWLITIAPKTAAQFGKILLRSPRR